MTYRLDLSRAIVAGLVAGFVFMMAEMILVWLAMGASPWGPPHMIAAIGMGEGVLPGPDNPPSFDLAIMTVAMVIHFLLSAILGIVYALVLARFAAGMAVALLFGALFGLAVYFVTFYGFTAIFPWFENARNWVSILSHVLFGAVLAWVYHGGRNARAVTAD